MAPARHVYAASQRTVALELPDGRYTLYAVANLGTDTGPLPEAEVRALRSAWNPDGSDSGTLPMVRHADVYRARHDADRY